MDDRRLEVVIQGGRPSFATATATLTRSNADAHNVAAVAGGQARNRPTCEFRTVAIRISVRSS
jgi:hypothetical protein